MKTSLFIVEEEFKEYLDEIINKPESDDCYFLSYRIKNANNKILEEIPFNKFFKEFDLSIKIEIVVDKIEGYSCYINKDKLDDDIKFFLDELGDNDFFLKIYFDKIAYIETFTNKYSNLNLMIFVTEEAFKNMFLSGYKSIEKAIKSDKMNLSLILGENDKLTSDSFNIVWVANFEEIDDVIDEAILSYSKKDMNKNYSNRQEFCMWDEENTYLIPEMFNFNEFKDDRIDVIKSLMAKIFVEILLSCISNSVKKNDEGKQYEIKGYKRILMTLPSEFEFDDYKSVNNIFKMYDCVFAYEKEIFDRLIMLRNIISLFITNTKNYKEDAFGVFYGRTGDILQSLQSDFEIYIQKNVKEYFNVRTKMHESIENNAKAVSDEICSIINFSMRIILSVLGILIAAWFSYKFTDKKDYSIVILALYTSMIYLFIVNIYILIYTNRRVSFIEDGFNNQREKLLLQMGNVDSEFGENNIVSKTKGLFGWYWWGTLLLMIGLECLGFWTISNIDKLLS